jgi:hypothetical protein
MPWKAAATCINQGEGEGESEVRGRCGVPPGATTSSTASCASEHCLASVSSSGPSGRVSRSSAAACVTASSADVGATGSSRVRLVYAYAAWHP